jgi:hypothetical protein
MYTDRLLHPLLLGTQVDSYLKDKFLRQKKNPSVWAESFVRACNHVKFSIVCCLSLSQALVGTTLAPDVCSLAHSVARLFQAPCILCALEVFAVLAIYFTTSQALLVHGVRRFSYKHSIDDVVGLCCTRAAILTFAYGMGSRSAHRYLYLAAVTCCLP